MYKQEPYLSEYIDVRAGVYFKPFYNVLADCGVRKLKSSLTDMRETYSENIYADFTQYLAEQLQEICMRTLIVEMHICKSAGKLKGENNREEYEYYCNKIVGEMVNIKKMFEKYPVLHQCVEKRITYSINFYKEILEHFSKHRATICDQLCRANCFLKIVSIESKHSDVHRGGRHVVKVRLDDGSEILYKPHSMENEKQFGELLHWMSQGLKIAQLDYKFLSYEDHSWCSIVEYKSCKTEDEIKKYYKRIGVQLFLAYFLGTHDLHCENIIASGEYPVLIDLETIVNVQPSKKRVTADEEVNYQLAHSVLYTGLLPIYTWNKDKYSLNMFFSLSREKENQKNQERDLVLEISGGEGMNDIEKQAFTLKDYEKVDEITDGQTFLYVVLPQFYSYKNENYEFVMILVDYKKLDLKNGYTYWGNGLQDIMNCEMNPIPQLEKKQMPTKIAELNWKTETDEIKLKKCVVAPITYMEQYKEEISSAAIHVEWKKKYLKNEEKTIQKIETYLYNSHDQSFRYRIYSPEIELRNNTIKVMTSLQAINKVALLFMAVFLTGMIAIYQLRFEHREESYGISLAYGAQYKELYWEIFCEILLLNSIGTIIGIVIGYLVTYYVDFGIMISVVNVQGSWYTFLSAYGLCVVLSSFVSVITFRKLKKKKIIELLNVY